MKRRVMVQEAVASLMIYHKVGYTVYKVLKAHRVITSQIGTKKSNAPFPHDKERKKNRNPGNACS